MEVKKLNKEQLNWLTRVKTNNNFIHSLPSSLISNINNIIEYQEYHEYDVKLLEKIRNEWIKYNNINNNRDI